MIPTTVTEATEVFSFPVFSVLHGKNICIIFRRVENKFN